MSRKPSAPPKVAIPRRRRSGALLRWAFALVCWGGVALCAYLVYCAYGLPDLDEAALTPRRPAVVVEAADGSIIATTGDLHGGYVRFEDLSPHLVNALLATEDRGFYSHFGIAPMSVLRAAWVNLRAGRVRQGASTVTQQVAKNLFLTQERTIHRKVQELLLAFWLEAKFSKHQILALYFNRVYFGGGTYGIEAAARRFYGTPARALGLYPSAALVGALKAPSRFNPLAAPEASDRRARQVLANMEDAGYLKPGTAAKVSRVAPVRGAGAQSHFFADWIVEVLHDRLGLADRDLWVRTTLDPTAQQIAEAALEDVLSRDGPAHDAGEGAVVVLDRSGAVRAMVGGRTYVPGGFNRATQAVRQPGSTIKPFVYLAALETGMTPDTPIEDAPIRIGDWAPQNVDGRFRGRVTLRQGLIHSINTVAVRLWLELGPQPILSMCRRFGLPQPETAGASVVLGTGETTLLDLTAAYAGLAAGGIGVWPRGIEAVRDETGRVVDRPAGGGPGRVADPAAVATLTGMMEGVMAEGTGRRARFGGWAAGKTGTTQNGRDAWFEGFSNRYVVGVWLGNDDNSPMKKVVGGTLPAEVWRRVMAKLEAR